MPFLLPKQQSLLIVILSVLTGQAKTLPTVLSELGSWDCLQGTLRYTRMTLTRVELLMKLHLRVTGKPSQYITSHLAQLSLRSLPGR